MITFSREGKQVIVHVQHGIWYDEVGFNLKIETHEDYQAELLKRQFNSKLSKELESIKEYYYKEGWKDAKGKKVAKRTWFPGTFKKI